MLLASFGVYWLGIGEQMSIPLRDVVYLVSPLLATMFGFWAVSIFGSRSLYSFTLLFLSFGMGCKFIGEILWFIFDNLLHVSPFPSAADYFFLLSYPLFAVAFILALKHSHVNWKSFSRLILFLLGLNGLWITVLVGYFDVYLAFDPAVSMLENVVAIGYGVADLVLLLICLFLLVLAWEYRAGRIVKTWRYLFIGFLVTLAADVLFAIFHDAYGQGVIIYLNIIDSLWIMGYLCVALGFYEFISLAHDARARIH